MLLQRTIAEVLSEPIDLCETMQGFVSDIKNQKLVIFPIGPTYAVQILQRTLDEAKIEMTIAKFPDLRTSTTPCRAGCGDIAIVGYSGRFPGSETNHEFWKNLEAGRKFDTKVSQRTVLHSSA